MAEQNSDQYQKFVDNKLANLPNAGGDAQMLRFRFKAPAAGVAINDLINFGYVKPGLRFNPADAKVHWTVGTATADLDLGHTGFSNISDDGVVSDVAASVDEFINAGDLATATLTPVAMLNARIGGIYVSDRNAAGAKTPLGMLLQGKVLIAAMPAAQEIVVELPVYAA